MELDKLTPSILFPIALTNVGSVLFKLFVLIRLFYPGRDLRYSTFLSVWTDSFLDY